MQDHSQEALCSLSLQVRSIYWKLPQHKLQAMRHRQCLSGFQYSPTRVEPNRFQLRHQFVLSWLSSRAYMWLVEDELASGPQWFL